MRTCEFTPLLSTATVPSDRLKEHLRRCEPCRLAADVLHASPRPHDRTPDCPEAEILVAFNLASVSPEESRSIEEHVDRCGYCIESLRLLNQDALDQPAANETFERADRELRTYLLAKEIAEWLTSQHYQHEAEAVAQTFDTAYEALQERSEQQPEALAAGALGFASSRGHRLSGLIIAFSALAAQQRLVAGDVSEATVLFETLTSGLHDPRTAGLAKAVAKALRELAT